jgi:hypothetical protein
MTSAIAAGTDVLVLDVLAIDAVVIRKAMLRLNRPIVSMPQCLNAVGPFLLPDSGVGSTSSDDD